MLDYVMLKANKLILTIKNVYTRQTKAKDNDCYAIHSWLRYCMLVQVVQCSYTIACTQQWYLHLWTLSTEFPSSVLVFIVHDRQSYLEVIWNAV